MARMYSGNFPELGDSGWEMVCEFNVSQDGSSSKDRNAVTWILFIQRQEHSDDWVNVKVAANGMVERKANYWLAKNLRTGQIGFSRDYAIMRETNEKLHEAVEIKLAELKPRESAIHPIGDK